LRLLLAVSFLAFWSCRLYKLEQKLDPENADFLSKVRYIITKAERKIFLELPDSEKADFREEFWKRRDPDPETDENEYKVEYFSRLEQADDLFRGEGKPGYLTDRGRIFILFGPPSERLTYPMEADSSCREVWYYGAFPVIFIDEHCAGQYVLTPVSLEHLQELNMAQDYFQKTFNAEKKFFDYRAVLKKKSLTKDSFEGLLVIDIPYAGLWYKTEEERLETELSIKAEIKDPKGAIVWEQAESVPVAVDEAELKLDSKKKYHLEIPVLVREGLDKLRRGVNTLQVHIKNSTEGEELKKIITFRIESKD